MPEISRFLGIVIRMFFTDNDKHHKPHIHIYYGEHEASLALDGEVLEGRIPSKQYKILKKWMKLHEEELYMAWNNSVRGVSVNKIAPYDSKADDFRDEDTMYISEDIVYGKYSEEPIKILEVTPLNNMIMLLKFNTGEIKIFDAKLLKGIVYEELEQEEIFNAPVIDRGVVTWKNGEIDCGPDFMYNNSYEYAEIS